VNPARSCGTCRHCSAGDPIACRYFTFNGYFGFSKLSERMYRKYPYGGMGEYMTAPASALVKIPDNVSYDQAARLGYIGTAYSGLRKAKVGPSTTLLINGASGTLGLGAVISTIALGVPRFSVRAATGSCSPRSRLSRPVGSRFSVSMTVPSPTGRSR
jgi:alcohol dehydrogenase